MIAEEAACSPDEQTGLIAHTAKRLFLRDVVMPLSEKPATPATVNWASEICPAYPVTTTSDSEMTARIKL